MDILKIFGLPAHPLLVHVPVVLLPLVGIGAIAMALSAFVRDRFGWLILGVAIAAGLSTQLAIGSGQALRPYVTRSTELTHHIQIAESIRPLALLLFLVAFGVMLIDRRAKGAWPFRNAGSAPSSLLNLALVVVTVLVAVGTNVRLFQIGDSGAKATWKKTQLSHTLGNAHSAP